MSTTTTETAVTTQVHRVYINASAERVWEAITSPEWNGRYGYHAVSEYDLKPGGKFRAVASPQMQEMGMPEVLLDGEVIEADPPRKLVQTWHALWDEGVAGEQPTRVTWDIEEDNGGLTRLTVTHELEGAPIHLEQVTSQAKLREGGGGWSWILSDLKTLLETGKSLEV
jgi:uncharacterized protein YndB with AHSA1/START domain